MDDFMMEGYEEVACVTAYDLTEEEVNTDYDSMTCLVDDDWY